MRHDRVGRPLYPADGGVVLAGAPLHTGACRNFSGCLFTPLPHPIGGVHRHEASPRVHAIRPFGLPLHLWPPDGTGALGLDHLSFVPRSYPRRTPGWGQAIDTGLELHLRHQPNLLNVAHSFPCAFMSHGAPMVLGCSAPDGYGANRTSTHTGRRPMLTSSTGFPERDQAADQQ